MKFSNSTNALINTNNGDVMCIEIKDIHSKCKFCNQQELDCASMGIMDGILSSPTLSLSNLVPNQTSIINLSGNELTYLNIDYSEMWVDSVRKLVVSHNQINILYDGTFNGATNLEVLDLSYNLIDFLQSDVFDNLRKLQTLDLSHNLLPRIDGFWFQGPRDLMRLNLSYNKIGRYRYMKRFPMIGNFNSILISQST